MADWPPLKNSAFTVTFPIYDADGDLVTGASSPDSEVSKDGGTFTDVSPGEASEIATSSGVYTLALSATEMNADIVATITKSGNGKTAVNVMYTVVRQLQDLAFPVTSGRGLLVESDNMVHADLKEWLGAAPLALSSQRVQTAVGAMGSGVITSGSFAAGAIDAAAIADAAIDAATFTAGALSSSAFAQGAADKVWSSATRNLTALGFTIANTDFASGAIDAAAIAADAIGSSEFAQAAADKVWSTATRNLTALGFSIANTDFAAGAIDAAAIANGAIDAATFAAGAIDDSAIAGDAITAAKIADDAFAAEHFATDAITSDALATTALNEIADTLLKRDIDQVEATAPVHSLTTAVLKAVSRIVDDAGTLKTYRTDGSTLHMSQTITVNASADPIDELTVGS